MPALRPPPFLIESMVADVVDYDEVKTGLHREGLYFGLWRMSAAQ